MNLATKKDVFKGALLLERQGKAFYHNVAQQTTNAGVRKMFEQMAAEEQTHIEILTELYIAYARDGKLVPPQINTPIADIAFDVINAEVRSSAKLAEHETAAISAAIALEEKAVLFYQSCAKNAHTDPERELFTWLANWEKTHMTLLAKLDEELMLQIWEDNNFWPQI